MIIRLLVLGLTIAAGVAILLQSIPLIVVNPIIGIIVSLFVIGVVFVVLKRTWAYLNKEK